MKVHVEIDCDNAAFGEGYHGQEVARILREVADRQDAVDIEFYEGKVRDINGNTVGRVWVTDKAEWMADQR